MSSTTDHTQIAIEVGRHTPVIEARYQAARMAFLEAARDLMRHGERFDLRAAGVVNQGQSELVRPIEVAGVSLEEIDALAETLR